MQVKDRVLAALEASRGTYLSGQALAQQLQVSRNAVWKAISQLRESGYPIQAVSHRGYCLDVDSPLLSPQSIARHLTVPGLQVEVAQTVSSTNTLLRFFSPTDTGLYLSLLLRPKLSAQDALLLTTCAAAAVALAIEACAGVEAQIKWVNDVFCRGKKVCGILTEAALDLESGGLQYAIVGMGVNLFPPAGGFPADLPQAGAVYSARPQGLESRSQLAGEILNQFFAFYPHLEEKPFFQAYRDRSLVLGREVTVLERGQTRTALALNLNPDFSLQVREADGRERALASGEVRVKL